MLVMRLVFVVLLLLNLLALAANVGWLGASAPRGEPERITNQLDPERIILRPPPLPAPAPAAPAPAAPAPAAALAPVTTAIPAGAEADDAPPVVEDPAAETARAEPDVCVAYAGLTQDEADGLVEFAAAEPPLVVERSTGTTPTAWWVRIPPTGSKSAAERAVGELRELGVTDLFIVHEPGPNQYAVSLGLFKTEAKAREHLAFLQDRRRVRGASITSRNAVVHRVQFLGPGEAIRALTNRLRGAPRSLSEVGCTP